MSEAIVLSFAQTGRRKTIHRVVDVDGARRIGTERCNTDDAAKVTLLDRAPADAHFCGHCFPNGAPSA